MRYRARSLFHPSGRVTISELILSNIEFLRSKSQFASGDPHSQTSSETSNGKLRSLMIGQRFEYYLNFEFKEVLESDLAPVGA